MAFSILQIIYPEELGAQVEPVLQDPVVLLEISNIIHSIRQDIVINTMKKRKSDKARPISENTYRISISNACTAIEEDEKGMTVPVGFLGSPARFFTLLQDEVAPVFRENS